MTKWEHLENIDFGKGEIIFRGAKTEIFNEGFLDPDTQPLSTTIEKDARFVLRLSPQAMKDLELRMSTHALSPLLTELSVPSPQLTSKQAIEAIEEIKRVINEVGVSSR